MVRWGGVKQTIRGFKPGNFSFVMATGIVAVAADSQGFGRLGYLLFWVAVTGYVIAAGLVIVRLSLYPEMFFEELRDYRHDRDNVSGRRRTKQRRRVERTVA